MNLPSLRVPLLVLQAPSTPRDPRLSAPGQTTLKPAPQPQTAHRHQPQAPFTHGGRGQSPGPNPTPWVLLGPVIHGFWAPGFPFAE